MKTLASILIFVLTTMLISSCATTPKNQQLYQGVESGDVTQVKRSIDKGANVNMRKPGAPTALMLASMYGYTEIVELLLEVGLDVNSKDEYGYTALEWAKQEKHKDIVNLLKEAGAKE